MCFVKDGFMFEVFWIFFVFVFGLFVKGIGFLFLVGYFVVGFLFSGVLVIIGFNIEVIDVFGYIVYFGVLLLLFIVGLKLKLWLIVSLEVIGGSLLYFGIICVVFMLGFYLLMDLFW